MMEGTLSDELVASMLRSFHLYQQELQASWQAEQRVQEVPSTAWKWSPGTFVFPEALCCYCGVVMRSPVIWRTRDLQFLGSWKVVDDGDGVGHFDVDRSHPHVHGGSICMGSGDYRTQSVADALFMSFNPLSSYFGGPYGRGPLGPDNDTNSQIKAWFLGRFNHRCGEDAGPAFVEGADNRHLLAPVKGCHCHHCRRHNNEVKCKRESCQKWYNPKVGHGRFYCGQCTGTVKIRYCTKHQHDIKMCANCEGEVDLWNTLTGELAESPNIGQCACGRWICRWCTGRHIRVCGLGKGFKLPPRDATATHCDGCCVMDLDGDIDCEGACEDCGHCDCEC